MKMSADDLAGWAEDCHLSAASADEKSRLNEALTADDRRNTVAQALDGLARRGGLPDVWDIPSLLRLEKWFSRDAGGTARTAGGRSGRRRDGTVSRGGPRGFPGAVVVGHRAGGRSG